MALEIFLRIDGITGSTRNFAFKGCADVLSWSWDLVHTNPEANSYENVEMNKISIVKRIGTDSPALMKLFAEQTTSKTAELTALPIIGKREAKQKYLNIILEDVMVKSIRAGGNIEEDLFSETILLQFGKMNYEYHQYTTASQMGTAATESSHAFGWDIAANAPR